MYLYTVNRYVFLRKELDAKRISAHCRKVVMNAVQYTDTFVNVMFINPLSNLFVHGWYAIIMINSIKENSYR